MADEEGGRRRRQSGVLDAIFEAVEEKPENARSGASPFRAAALARLDIPEQIDNLLPITSRRTWLAVVGVALVIVAFLVYAAVTTTVTAVTVQGRTVAPSGIAQAASPDGAVITNVLLAEGDRVSKGDVIAEGVDANGTAISVQAPVSGTVWQELVLTGGVVMPGTIVATVLPDGSDRSVLVGLDESSASSVTGAERIDITVPGVGTVAGTLRSATSAPVPASNAASRTGIPPMSDEMTEMVSIDLADPVPAGAEVTVSFVLSESTLLQSMLGLA